MTPAKSPPRLISSGLRGNTDLWLSPNPSATPLPLSLPSAARLRRIDQREGQVSSSFKAIESELQSIPPHHPTLDPTAQEYLADTFGRHADDQSHPQSID